MPHFRRLAPLRKPATAGAAASSRADRRAPTKRTGSACRPACVGSTLDHSQLNVIGGAEPGYPLQQLVVRSTGKAVLDAITATGFDCPAAASAVKSGTLRLANAEFCAANGPLRRYLPTDVPAREKVEMKAPVGPIAKISTAAACRDALIRCSLFQHHRTRTRRNRQWPLRPASSLRCCRRNQYISSNPATTSSACSASCDAAVAASCRRLRPPRR